MIAAAYTTKTPIGIESGGVECWMCSGGGTDDSARARDDEAPVPCPECAGEGKVNVEYGGEEDIPMDVRQDVMDVAFLVSAARERQPTPMEWLGYPAMYAAAFRYLSRFIFNEFESIRENLGKS